MFYLVRGFTRKKLILEAKIKVVTTTMEDLLARIKRIQQDFQNLSKELDDVLKEYAPTNSSQSEPNLQVILPARKRGRPKKTEAVTKEATNQIQKAEEAAVQLVNEQAALKPKRKLKKIKMPHPPEPHTPPPPAICRTCGIDLTLGADHRHCFFGYGFLSSSEWMQDCVAYAAEIGAGVAYTP